MSSAEHTSTGIPYLSGGVGLDERDALRAVSGEYNLHVTFAQREGNYLSDVHVAIQNANGATLLETVPQGPWLFTKLPPGRYTVIAGHQRQSPAVSRACAGNGTRRGVFLLVSVPA